MDDKECNTDTSFVLFIAIVFSLKKKSTTLNAEKFILLLNQQHDVTAQWVLLKHPLEIGEKAVTQTSIGH